MNNTFDVMLDIETLGTDPDAAIVQIGAVKFDPDKNESIKESDIFLENINLKQAMEFGSVNPETILWWLGQDKNVINSVFKTTSRNIQTILDDLRYFWKHSRYLWSHATFDAVILNWTIKKVLGDKKGYPFRNIRDLRTEFGALDQEEIDRIYHKYSDFENKDLYIGPHNAAYDCIRQILVLREVRKIKRQELHSLASKLEMHHHRTIYSFCPVCDQNLESIDFRKIYP